MTDQQIEAEAAAIVAAKENRRKYWGTHALERTERDHRREAGPEHISALATSPGADPDNRRVAWWCRACSASGRYIEHAVAPTWAEAVNARA